MLPLFFVSCVYYANGTVGKGSIVTEQIKSGSFTSIENFSSAEVQIEKGDSFRVELSDYENLVDLWDIKVIDNKLVIQTKPFTSLVNTRAKVHIVMPDQLNKVTVFGSGEVQINSAFENLESVRINGSGNITGSADTNFKLLKINISGSGNVRLKGVSNDVQAAIYGSGKIYLSDVKTQNADCLISGSGDIYLTVEEKLKVAIYGSGNIYYSGRPVIDVTSSGSGRLISQ
jgi:hypothetical protein